MLNLNLLYLIYFILYVILIIDDILGIDLNVYLIEFKFKIANKKTIPILK